MSYVPYTKEFTVLAGTIDDFGEMSTAQPMRLVIVGAGGHGKEVAAYVSDIDHRTGSIDLVGFVDESRELGDFGGSKVIGDFEALKGRGFSTEGLRFITAVGDNSVRKQLAEKAVSHGLGSWTLVHNDAYVGVSAGIGGGTCIAPGSVVTVDVDIGRHCIVNVNASISHDCNIGDYSNINPNAVVCGNVEIGEGGYIGAGAVVREKVKIGAWSVVGAGAAVLANIPDGATVVGVPARVVDTRT